jgi:sulfatase maturation enzyme AslB (radical SAM superfamily)
MLAGERPHACNVCYIQEDNGVESFRIRSNREYKIFDDAVEHKLKLLKYPKNLPVNIEMQLTNLCNLKCVSCNESESSSILHENKILKINLENQSQFDITDNELHVLKELLHTGLRKLVLRGGEPLIVPQVKALLKYAVDNHLIDNTIIVLVTNGTRFNQEWFDILSKIKKLKIHMSVDGVGKLNDYLRFGSNWNHVEQNCKLMSMIPNVNFFIHAAISNMNILHIDKLIDWCAENKYYLNYDLITQPVEFEVTNLPDELKTLAIERLKNKKEMSNIINKLKNSLVIRNWEKFKNTISLRERVRKNSIIEVVPELKNYL